MNVDTKRKYIVSRQSNEWQEGYRYGKLSTPRLNDEKELKMELNVVEAQTGIELPIKELVAQLLGKVIPLEYIKLLKERIEDLEEGISQFGENRLTYEEREWLKRAKTLKPRLMDWEKVLPKKSYVDVLNDETKQIDKVEEEWNQGYNKAIDDCLSALKSMSEPSLMGECPEQFKLLEHNSKDQLQFGGCEDTRKFLEEGKTYEGKKEVHSWHTKIWINGHCFNSVCFEEVGTGKKPSVAP